MAPKNKDDEITEGQHPSAVLTAGFRKSAFSIKTSIALCWVQKLSQFAKFLGTTRSSQKVVVFQLHSFQLTVPRNHLDAQNWRRFGVKVQNWNRMMSNRLWFDISSSDSPSIFIIRPIFDIKFESKSTSFLPINSTLFLHTRMSNVPNQCNLYSLLRRLIDK